MKLPTLDPSARMCVLLLIFIRVQEAILLSAESQEGEQNSTWSVQVQQDLAVEKKKLHNAQPVDI